MKEARLEVVQYDTDRIAKASAALVALFARYSGIYGTNQWLGHLVKIINEQRPIGFSLNAEGVELVFSGFKNPSPKVRDGIIVFDAREPRFVIEEKPQVVLPRQRTRIERAVSDISNEMNAYYHVRREFPPYTLIFPKQEFARSAQIFPAKLL